MEIVADKWRLVIGCHIPGKINSRDTIEFLLDSLGECRNKIEERREAWASIGYSVWFASIYNPKGEKVTTC